jgi:phospholipid/cholesterol/gamma-HCH transport system permease protein
MTVPPCRLDTAAGPPRLLLSGEWRLDRLAALDAAFASLPALAPDVIVDGAGVEALDTAGALLLLERLARAGLDPARLALDGFAEPQVRVIDVVRGHLAALAGTTRVPRPGPLASFGAAATALAHLVAGHVNFLGVTAAALARTVLHPRRLRIKELTAQFQQVCLNAIPVVAMVAALIGVVFAYLLGLQAEKYGANIFVVDGVAIGMTRELAPMIVAVIVAGRSGAAFTAQLGTMRLTEETDAIRTLGLSPIEVLVLPRVLALMVALPLLTFVGDVAGIVGAMLVSGPMLDVTPTSFMQRLHVALTPRHFLIGLGKAPVFAVFIAVIGCRMGMTVSRDTRAIGISTTSTVVQSIVAVILLDAVFAVFFQRLGL